MKTGWIVLLAASAAMAQSFEAASVQPAGAARGRALRGGPGTGLPGELSGIASLKSLVLRAYDVKDYQVSAPSWMDSERYQVEAKIPPQADRAAVSKMLQALLAERFHLAVRRETRRLPVYFLTLAKGGPKFHQAKPAAEEGAEEQPVDPKFRRGADGLPDLQPGADVPRSYEVVLSGSDGVVYKLWGRHETMAQLAGRLSTALGRVVVDRTGLADRYNFTLTWSVESAGGVIPRTGPPPDEIESHRTPVLTDPGLSVFHALQEQMGLTLRPGKGPVDMLIVERADRVPAGN
jgi:uncharacterized protein (TIGR03435 family)